MKPGYALTGVAAALLVSLTLFVSHLTAESAPPAGGASTMTEARQPFEASTRFLRELGKLDPGPQISLTLTDSQQLITDSALRAVMDYFLLERSDDGRLQALRDYLTQRLPPAAVQDALRLADQYSAYLTEHDALLAAQNFIAAPDQHRLASWQQQRRQLRVRMLGERVTEEWFGTEDTYLTQALAEAMQATTSTPADADEARHREHMQQVLRDAVSSAAPVRYPYAPMIN